MTTYWKTERNDNRVALAADWVPKFDYIKQNVLNLFFLDENRTYSERETCRKESVLAGSWSGGGGRRISW